MGLGSVAIYSHRTVVKSSHFLCQSSHVNVKGAARISSSQDNINLKGNQSGAISRNLVSFPSASNNIIFWVLINSVETAWSFWVYLIF